LTQAAGCFYSISETAMAENVELKKSDGGYMSVDAAEAVEHNRPVIDALRKAFLQAAAKSEASLPEPPVALTSAK
jgi:hypothetical protein